MHRLEERVSDMKSENQILQHALVTSPFKRGLEYPPTPTTKNLENGHHANEESRMNEPQGSTPAKNLGMESSSNLKRPPIDRQHVNANRDHNYLAWLCRVICTYYSGIDENAVGACAQLVIAPIDESCVDDAPLLPFGFRVIPLDPKSDKPSANRTLDLASTLEVRPGGTRPHGEADLSNYNLRSVLTIAFQFTFENHFRDNPC